MRKEETHCSSFVDKIHQCGGVPVQKLKPYVVLISFYFLQVPDARVVHWVRIDCVIPV